MTKTERARYVMQILWVEMESIDGASAREVVQEIEDSLI